jgi:MYXO-CTERM domain-containing protein
MIRRWVVDRDRRRPRARAVARLAGVLLGVAALVAGRAAPAGEDAGASQDAGPAGHDPPGAIHIPPAESRVDTPLPLYVELPEERRAWFAVLMFKPFGASAYERREMTRMGRGFGVLIPCEEVSTTGDVAYYFALFDEAGRLAGALGSPRAPFRVVVANELAGDPPRLPGESPPHPCPRIINDPPCVFDPSRCETTAAGTWPSPLPRARAKGCAGCSTAASDPGGGLLGLMAVVALPTGRARRRSSGRCGGPGR